MKELRSKVHMCYIQIWSCRFSKMIEKLSRLQNNLYFADSVDVELTWRLLDLQQQLEGFCEIGSIRPSVCPSILLSFHLSGRFLGIVSLVFSKFQHGARNPYEIVHDRTGFSGTNFFAPKIGKMHQKCTKNRGFYNLLKNLVINFYWICSTMKIYIICCVPAQIPYLGKFLFQRNGPECSQPIRLQDFSINHISRTDLCMLI